MEHLHRIDKTTDGPITASAIRRDSESPSLDTYYRRLGWEIGTIVDAYHDWQETGVLPEESGSIDWNEFHAQLHAYSVDDLMDHLKRLDADPQIESPPSASDVRNDADAPCPATYYDRFDSEGRAWDNVLAAYRAWIADTAEH